MPEEIGSDLSHLHDLVQTDTVTSPCIEVSGVSRFN